MTLDLQKSNVQTKSASTFLLVIAIILVAANLRPAITSVGPIIGTIQKDVGLAHWSAGLLMSLPLILFAVISPVVPKLANRWTNEGTLLIGLIVLFAGIGIRLIPMTFLLFGGTILIGVGIAIGNVLLPAVAKDKFPQKFGLMTSVYSTTLGLLASLASGVSVPLAHGLNLGWQGSLSIWGIPVIMAIIVWAFLLKTTKEPHKGINRVRSSSKQVWSSPLAWQIALFLGFQACLFYVTVSWLPEILHSRGISLSTSGWLLSFTQIVGLPVSFIIPVIAGRYRSQIGIAFWLGLSSVLGYGGLVLGSSFPILIISILLIGIGLGGNFPLALSYLGLRAQNAKQAAELSGMAQSTGYVLASLGPLFMGYLFDRTQMWTVPLITLIIISIACMLFGMISGRNKYV